MRPACFTSCIVAAATASLTASTALAQTGQTPIVTGVSPTIVTRGEPLTIAGTSLLPPAGWSVFLRGTARYDGGLTSAFPTSQSATQLRFDAPPAGETPMRLVYQPPPLNDSLGNRNAIAADKREPLLPSVVVVQGPPKITWSGPTQTADIGASFPILAVQGGQATIKGRWLRKGALATVTFNGSPLTVMSHAYEPTGSLNGLTGSGGGADRLVFGAPGVKATGWLTVAHALGRDSALVTVSPPPVVSEVRVQDGTTTRVVTAGQSLHRGRTYILRGQHLSLTHAAGGGTSIKRGTVRLGTTDIAPTFASDTNIVFIVPTTFSGTSAALAAVTPMGVATVGTFPVTNQVAAIGVTAVTPSTLTLISGRDAQLFATTDIPINTPAEALGTLRITLPAGATNALQLPANGYPVAKGGPTEMKVRGGDLQNATPFTMTVAHESNVLDGQPTATRSVAVTVRPPHPIRFKDTSPLTAGSSPRIDVVLDSATRVGSTLFALLSSSNPNVVSVPASATMSREFVPFTATIPPLLQPSSVTLTATVDGVSISQLYQVVLPVPTAVAASATTVKPYEEVLVTATINGELAAGQRATFVASDTSLKFVSSGDDSDADIRVKSRDPRNSVRYAVSRGLVEQRQVQVSVSYGGQTRSVSITATPVLLSSFTATPTSGHPGTTLQATALLNTTAAASSPGYRLEVASSDTTLAAIDSYDPAIPTSATSKVVVVRLKGAPTTSRQVPITATLKTGGYVVSTRTLVVTVNP